MKAPTNFLGHSECSEVPEGEPCDKYYEPNLLDSTKYVCISKNANGYGDCKKGEEECGSSISCDKTYKSHPSDPSILCCLGTLGGAPSGKCTQTPKSGDKVVCGIPPPTHHQV